MSYLDFVNEVRNKGICAEKFSSKLYLFDEYLLADDQNTFGQPSSGRLIPYIFFLTCYVIYLASIFNPTIPQMISKMQAIRRISVGSLKKTIP